MLSGNQARVSLPNSAPVLINGNSLQNAPVPQGLYRNQSVMSTNASAQPQTLFYNLGNNQLHPALNGGQVQPQPQLRSPVPSNTGIPQRHSSPATYLATNTQPPVPKPQDAKYNIDATQIRIGTCKFVPDTSVTFKNEGVLFSLKGKHTLLYSHYTFYS